MSDRPVAGTSTWIHTTPTTDTHPCPGGIRTRNLSNRVAAKPSLRASCHQDRLKSFLEVNNHSDTLELPHILWNTKFKWHARINPPLNGVLRQMNAVHNLSSCSLHNLINITLETSLKLSNSLFPTKDYNAVARVRNKKLSVKAILDGHTRSQNKKHWRHEKISEYCISDVTIKLVSAFLWFSKNIGSFSQPSLHALCYCSTPASISEKHHLYRR